MEKLFNEFLYQIDYVFGYISMKPRKLPYYHRYMWEKYGTRYCTKDQFDEYWNGAPDEPTSGYVDQG
jgi:hypothetical protein